MATLNKLKLLPSTQYPVAASPSRSPSKSPVFHIHRRRRRTLRMLLSRPDRCTSPVNQDTEDDDGNNPPVDQIEKEVGVRRKLKDLFVSSPPLEENILNRRREQQEGFQPAAGNSAGNINGTITRRSIWTTFQYRLLRRAWRPVLVSIPE